MEYEPFNLTQVQTAIQQIGAKWIAAESWLTQLSPDEKRMRLGAVPSPEEVTLDERERVARASFQAGPGLKAAGVPAAYDLRNAGGKNFITPVKNQGSCGSCIAFGSVAAVEGTMRLAKNNPNLEVDLSEAHLFYCHAAQQGRNCRNGWWVDPALEAFRNIGVVDEDCFKYTPGDQPCRPCSDWQTRVTKILAWRKLENASAMKEWISTKGPVAACFKVYDDFYAYHSGVYRHVTGDFLGGHCVCVIGYNDTDGCWICKNSWGSNWGENGFFRIAYGDCGIDYTMWAVEMQEAQAVWLRKKLITGLWNIFEEDRKARVFVSGLDWYKVPATSDSVFLGTLALLASAKANKSPVDLRVEDDVIKEVYVF
jgi:C1A family cysteine protease